MRTYEASAKTVEEAIEKGLQEMGLSIGDVEVQVVEEGSKGLFGLFGSRPAKVRLTAKEDNEDPLSDLITAEEPVREEKKAPVRKEVRPAEEKQPERKPAPENKPEPEQKAAESEVKTEEADQPSEKRPAPVRREAKKSRKPAAPRQEKEAEETAESAEPAAAARMEKPEVHMIPADQLDPESAAGRACAFLKEMTRLMGVEVTVEMGTDDEGNVYGYMNGDTLGILIGRRGETLDALQYLTSLKVNRGQENYTRVTLDTENYRAKREDTLIRLANRMANRALRTGRRVSLEPMNPYERRVIHYALQKNGKVDTHSEGDEPSRHVVITLKK